MLCKGIVDKVIDAYSCRVRIPIYHQAEGTAFATPSEQLPIATICCMPGSEYALRKNEVVWVDFEIDDRAKPVIMGVLSRKDTNSSSNITAKSITAEVNCNLPENIFINQDNSRAKINFRNIFEEVAQDAQEDDTIEGEE